MSSIDNRVVNMKFDNAQFEKGVAQTTQTLSKFNQDLNTMSGKSVDFGGMVNGIDTVAHRFSWFGDLAFQAMSRVNNAILDATQTMYGYVRMVSSPLSGVNDGFTEYELKMGAVQTILAGVNDEFASEEEALTKVNEKLEELNAYSDKTIYSFRDMTSNIGKFTNAGVNLDQSVAAIQGIANLAALSGANANDASRAMYNFAQALSKGYVQLIDWKSIENANMATEEFKQELIESAVACGNLVEGTGGLQGLYIQVDKTGKQIGEAFNATQNFNDSLKDGWLSSEVLIDKLGDYADPLTDIGKRATDAATQVKTFSQLLDTTKESLGSGWAQSFEILIGNFVEARELWTNVNEVIGGFIGANADARNTMLQTWKSMGGRAAVLQGIANGFWTIVESIGAIKQGFRDVFPPTSVNSLLKATKAFRDFMAAMRPSEVTLERFSRISRGLASVMDILLEPIRMLIRGVRSLIAPFKQTTDGAESFLDVILEIIADIADFIFVIRTAIKQCTSLEDAFALIKKGAENLWKDLSSGFQFAFDRIYGIVSGILTKIADYIQKVMPSLDLSAMLNFDLGNWREIIPKLKEYAQLVKDYAENIFAKLLEFGRSNPIIDGLVEGLVSGVKKVKEAIIFVAEWIKKAFCDLLGIHSPSTVFYEYGQNIWEGLILGLKSLAKQVYKAVMWVGAGMAKAFKWAIDLTMGFLNGMGKSVREVFDDAAAAVNDFTYKLAYTDFSVLDYIQKKFNDFNIEGSTFGNIVKIFQNIIDFFKPVWFWAVDTFGPLVNYIWEKLQLITPANIAALLAGRGMQLTGLGIFKFLSDLNKTIEPLTKGLGDMFKGLGEIGKSFSTLLGTVGDTFKAFQLKIKAEALRSIAVSFVLLAAAFGAFGMLPWETIAGSITGMLAAAGALSGVLFTLSRVNLSGGVNLVGIATGLLMISWALENLASVDLWGLIKAWGALALTLDTITVFIWNIDSIKLLAVSAAMGKFALALYGIAWSVEALGENEWYDLVEGVGALLGTFAGLGFILQRFPFKMSTKLLSLAGAMLIFSYAIDSYSSIEMDKMAIGLINLGLALATVSGVLFTFNYLATKFGTTGVMRLPKGLVGLAIAMTMLTLPIGILGMLPWEVIKKGLIALGAALTGIVIAMVVLSKFGKDVMYSVSLGIMAIAGALTALIIPVQVFGTMDPYALGIGVMTLALMLAGLVKALQEMPSNDNLIKLAVAIGTITAALVVLSIAVAVLGNADWDVLLWGIGTMATVLYGLVYVLKETAGLELKAMGLQLLALGAAIGVMAAGVYVMGTLDPWAAFQGVVAMGSMIFLLSKALKALQTKDTLSWNTIGLIAAVAGALTLMSLPLIVLSQIHWTKLLIGLAALAALIVVVGGAVAILNKVLPGGSLLVEGFGRGVAYTGAGLLAAAAAVWILIDAIGKLGKLISKAWNWIWGKDVKAEEETSLSDGVVKEMAAVKEAFAENNKTITSAGKAEAAEIEKSGDQAAEVAEKKTVKLADALKIGKELTSEEGIKDYMMKQIADIQNGSDEMSSEMEMFAKAMDSSGRLNTDLLSSDLQKLFTKSNGVINKDGRELRDSFNAIPEDIRRQMGMTEAFTGDVTKNIGHNFNQINRQLNPNSVEFRTKMWQQQVADYAKTGNNYVYREIKISNEKINDLMNKYSTERRKVNINELPEAYQKMFSETADRIYIGTQEITNGLTDFTKYVNDAGYIDVDQLSSPLRALIYNAQQASVDADQKIIEKERRAMMEKAADKDLVSAFALTGLDPEYAKAMTEKFLGASIKVFELSGNEFESQFLKLGLDGRVIFEGLENSPELLKQFIGRWVEVTKTEGDKVIQGMGYITKYGTIEFAHGIEAGETEATGSASELVNQTYDTIEKETEAAKEKAAESGASTGQTFLDYFFKTTEGKNALPSIIPDTYLGELEDSQAMVTDILKKMGINANDVVSGDLDLLRQKMGEVGKAMTDPIHEMQTVMPDALGDVGTTAKDELKKVLHTDEIAPIAKNVVDVVVNTFKTGKVDVEAAAADLGKSAVISAANSTKTAIAENFTSEAMKPVGDAVVGAIDASLQDGSINLNAGINELKKVAIEDAAGATKEIISEKLNTEQTAPIGEMLDKGIAVGIKDGEIYPVEAAKAMAGHVIDATQEKFDIQSPSKVFAQIGQYVDQGLADGITTNIPTVTSATEALGNNTTHAIMDTLSNLSALDMDLDVQPTITPVMDLTGVKKDSKQISGLLRQATGTSRTSASSTGERVSQARKLFGSGGDSSNGTNSNTLTRPQGNVVMNNTYNVKNESDARLISNKVGTLMSRSQYARGLVVAQ